MMQELLPGRTQRSRAYFESLGETTYILCERPSCLQEGGHQALSGPFQVSGAQRRRGGLGIWQSQALGLAFACCCDSVVFDSLESKTVSENFATSMKLYIYINIFLFLKIFYIYIIYLYIIYNTQIFINIFIYRYYIYTDIYLST